VTVSETKLTCLEQASFCDVCLDYLQNNFIEYLPYCGQEANRTSILRGGVLTGFRYGYNFRFLPSFWKMGQPKAVIK
jgi:hypothetical protein